MEIGNLVVRKDGNQLRSGASVYQGAIVVSINPFILVSEELDMKWSSLKIEDFEIYKDKKIPLEEMEKYFKRADINYRINSNIVNNTKTNKDINNEQMNPKSEEIKKVIKSLQKDKDINFGY